eukprot:XP_001702828.1 predicted protein [Chlamydomonas reinhardtii]
MARSRLRQPASGDDQLTESLLDDYDARDADDVAPEPHEPPHKAVPSAAAPSRHTALIVHPGEFNLQAFIQSVLAWWQRMFGACFGPIFSYATHLWPVPSREPQLSLLQAERLQQLRDKVAERFDIASPSHQDSLRRLWSLAFSGEPCTALKTPRWKDMGWQSVMPTGAAAAAAAAAANSNSDSSGPRPPRGAAGRAFLTLLSESEVAFEELYCAAYCLLDATWLEMRASYMEFNAVMKRVKGQVEKALASRPADMAQLRQRLLAGVPGAAVWD